MKHDPDLGQPINHMVNVVVACEHCGELTRVRMTPEQAAAHANTVLAAVDDLDVVSVDPGSRPQG